jgi:hypothetical protein
MALLNDRLTLWEISFRWAGLDPGRAWLRIPLAVKDNARTLLDAVWQMHLHCATLAMEKWAPDSELPPKFFIRYHLGAIRTCVEEGHFPRRLLRWAVIERWDLYLWCKRQGVPLPEFWFPPGWRLTYMWPEEPQLYGEDGVPLVEAAVPLVEAAGEVAASPVATREEEAADATHGPRSGEEKLRHNQRAKIACQVVAETLWRRMPQTTIAAMVKHEEIQMLCGASHYDDETVRSWIKVVAPDAVRKKRGRPRKGNPDEDE